MSEILHVTSREGWEATAAEGEYRGDTLAAEGFLHGCSPGQLPGVVERYFRGRGGLVVLRIDVRRLSSPLRWEAPPGGRETFPHIYGPLNREAVVGVVALEEFLEGRRGSGDDDDGAGR